MYSHLWDFDENKNYINYNGYKVLNLPDYEHASRILEDLNALISKGFIHLELTNKTKRPEIQLLLDTPFKLQEMQLIKDQLDYKFDGLNKPKKVYKTNKIEIGKDKKLRAKNRLIFLTLRNKNGRFKSYKTIVRLLAHELTHTALNHVTWRDDDHGPKFNMYNKIIYESLII
jgi:hypothetical protein